MVGTYLVLGSSNNELTTANSIRLRKTNTMQVIIQISIAYNFKYDEEGRTRSYDDEGRTENL